jgi:hypothetical protein
MNLADTISLYAGGPGSGCRGPNCGRKKVDPVGNKGTVKLIKEGASGHVKMFEVERDADGAQMIAVQIPNSVTGKPENQLFMPKDKDQAERYYERMKTFLEKNPDKVAPWSIPK